MNDLFSFHRIKKLWADSDSPIILFPQNFVSFRNFELQLTSLVKKLRDDSEKDWILYCEEPGLFLLAFFALLYSGKNIHLPGNAPEEKRNCSYLSDTLALTSIKLRFSYDDKIQNDTPRMEQTGNFGKVILYTSGSTGVSKKESKNFSQIENEIGNLAALWGNTLSEYPCYSTVSHQHFYGLLFSILLPFSCGYPIGGKRIQYPESLNNLKTERFSLISSPAFLKRIEDSQIVLRQKSSVKMVFSSGGFLPRQHAEYCQNFFQCKIQEIYGSTETGGIAWKNPVKDLYWKPFPGISLRNNKEETLLHSPYLPNNNNFILDDNIHLLDSGEFELLGRKDSIVKIEEKRIALNDISNRLLETPYVQDSAMIKLENRRQYIGAVIELNEDGRKFYSSRKKKDLNLFFRNHLLQYFPATVIPKKWRYPDRIPVNAQGKVHSGELKSMFERSWLDQPEMKEQQKIAGGWRFVIEFPQNYRYFDGHFPEMKILPAVVQTHWIMEQYRLKYAKPAFLKSIPRMKFMNPVFPDRPVEVQMIVQTDLAKIQFHYLDLNSGNFCSKGIIKLKEEI